MARLKLAYPTFRQPKRIVHGRGSLRTVAAFSDLDTTAIFISGNAEVRSIFEATVQKSASPGPFAILAKTQGEPTRRMVETGARFLQERSFTRILAIGGGSVLDWSRLAWAHARGLLPDVCDAPVVLPNRVDVGVPFCFVPTTCATGAEAAAVAVLAETTGTKIPVVSDAFLADSVILDGRFLDGASESLVADSLGDLLSHAIESFLSIVSSPFAEVAAVGALQAVLGDDAASDSSVRRQSLMEAAYLAGLAASNCSVGVVHAFAHTIARLGVAHAHANALGLVAGIMANFEVPRLQELAQRLGFTSKESFVERIRQTLKAAANGNDQRLAERLDDTDLRTEIVDAMAADTCLRTNPKRLTNEELTEFLADVVREIQFDG